jgi:hypothetical protein
LERIMKNKALLSAAVIIILFSLTAWSAENRSISDAQWIEDIDYLAGRMQVMHPNLYANVTEEEFRAALEGLKERVPEMSDSEIALRLHEIAAMVQDAHTSVALWRFGQCAITDGWKAYPVNFYPFEDGIYITAAGSEHGGIVGSRVLRLDDVPAEEAFSRVSRLAGADNDQGRLNMGWIYLMLHESLEYFGIIDGESGLTLTLAGKDGAETEYLLEPVPVLEAMGIIYIIGQPSRDLVLMNAGAEAPLPLYLSRPGDLYWYEYIPEHGTMYVSLLAMVEKEDDPFEEFCGRMFAKFDSVGARKLVLDVRYNEGGEHFELPLLKGVISRPRIDDPRHLFVLTGRTTVSASQHFVTQFDLYTNATFVGEATSGKPNHYGAQRFFNLPNSRLPVRSSVVYHQDATEWDMSHSSRPNFEVRMTSADFAGNRDPVMDFVLGFDRYADTQSGFEKTLGDAYTESGISGLRPALDRFIADHSDTGANIEWLMNGFSWWMSANKREKEDYTEYLRLFTEYCPGFSGAWYSLGVRLQNSGDLEGAERCLERSVEVYPGNEIAKRRLALLLFEEEWKNR